MFLLDFLDLVRRLVFNFCCYLGFRREVWKRDGVIGRYLGY